jgi:hypothetical protein
MTQKNALKYTICDNLRNLLIDLKCYLSEFLQLTIYFEKERTNEF